MSVSYRVSVDRDSCTGHGRCVELCPDVFQLDTDGFSLVRVDARYPELTTMQRVAALCPELAINVEEQP